MSDPDWRALFLKYVRAVVDDDHIVGLTCLEPEYGGWSEEEQKLMLEIHKEVWTKDLEETFGPWSEDKYDRKNRSR